MREAAEATSTGPPWLAITLALIAVIAPLAAAGTPVLVERIRQRGVSRHEGEQEAAPARADRALEMVEQSLRDAWQQRDEADDRADQLRQELTKVRAELERCREREQGPNG